MLPISEQIIFQLFDTPEPELTIDFLKTIKRTYSKEHKLSNIISNIQLIRAYQRLLKEKKIISNTRIEELLRKRAVRSQSWIVSVQVLTKPFGCPGECIFCPNDPTMPKSYIKTEPGAMRALLNSFDPYRQAYNRLLSLKLAGHNIDKIEMIVLGWTRDVYPTQYKKEFIKGLYDACNTFDQFFDRVELPDENTPSTSKNDYINKEAQKMLWISDEARAKFAFSVKDIESIRYPETREESIKQNETANQRMIGLTIETRPEYVTDENCQLRRELWVTRLEIWLQSMDDEVLRLNKRGHDVETMRKALHKLRQYAFKMSVHMMPGLFGSTPQKDIESMKLLYEDDFLKPDELKFYPTSVIPNTELHELFKRWEYTPLATSEIKEIIRDVLLDIIPPYTRIKRLIRDIPSTEIVAGSQVTNLSQLTRAEIQKEGNTKRIQQLYTRLYGKFKVFDSIDIYLNQEELPATSIIWQAPDLESIRNFVAIDTRSREITNRRSRNNQLPQNNPSECINLIIREYPSSVGTEYFISFEDELGYLYGFTRLLLPKIKHILQWEGLWEHVALIRELHVYWNLETIWKLCKDVSIKRPNLNATQHKGFGKQLLQVAEKISSHNTYKKLSVISWVGVREYYKKQWYTLEWTYMLKNI